MNEATALPDRIAPLLLDEQLCFALYAATNAMTRTYRPLLAELGLTYPQYLVMLVLWEQGGTAVGAIAERLRLGASAVVPLLDQLERSALVCRARGGPDRRRVWVTLTDAGAALRPAVGAARAAVACHTGLIGADYDRLRAQLQVLTECMTGAGTPPVSRELRINAAQGESHDRDHHRYSGPAGADAKSGCEPV